MVSILKALIGVFWKKQENQDDQFSWPVSPFENDQKEEANLNDKSSIRSFQGKVTHVFVNHGLINHEVYFSFDNLTDVTRTEVGDVVDVEAKRHHSEGGWFATRISMVTKTWEDEIEEPDLQKNSIVGKVTLCTQDGGEINDKIVFSLSALSDYRPLEGDWVTADLEDGDEDQNDDSSSLQQVASSVQPLRIINFQGEVTAAMADHGYIDREVFYPLFVCLNGYRPRKRDQVMVTAIESNQKGCTWRATTVVPCSNRQKRYVPREVLEKTKSPAESFIVQGQRPRRFTTTKYLPRRMPNNPVPESLRNHVLNGEELTHLYPHLAQVLTPANFVNRFSLLLHLEEIQMELNMEEFDMYSVCLRHAGPFLALQVPGLAEGRPSILIGDQILLSEPTDPQGIKYEGIVHEVYQDEVMLKFNDNFQSKYSGEDFDVSFKFKRTTLQRCHHAVTLALTHLGPSVLFPDTLKLKNPQVNIDAFMAGRNHRFAGSIPAQASRPNHFNGFSQTGHPAQSPSQSCAHPGVGSLPKSDDSSCPINVRVRDSIRYVNPRLNNEQKMAVTQILLGQCRPLPYVIFGPPGTGKTITLVEAILQVWRCCSNSRILACTPSNSAADLLVERIHESGLMKTSDMVRVNAFQRQQSSIPDVVLKYSELGVDTELVARYRIVVCTCSTAGLLYKLGLRPGHFTHAVVDESGQANEPECLIPLSLVGASDGQIVLAGDPKQLGPVIMSAYAKTYGLELSFLERLMERPLYTRDQSAFTAHGGFDPALVTMLVKNYRSHPSILHLSSRLFYFGELESVADPALTHQFCQWSQLPTAAFPIIFHGSRGEDLKDSDSPSWYNAVETVTAVQYLQSLLALPGITADDVGIITPYRKQVEKMRLLLEELGMDVPKVGSVEEFQGQERKVIIISTVRSNESLIGFDVRHTLGFLSNAKRFNVAITRAHALLIVVGNPVILSQDENWRQLICYCLGQGGYRGCKLPPKLKAEGNSSATATVTDDELSNRESAISRNQAEANSKTVARGNHTSNPGAVGSQNSESSTSQVVYSKSQTSESDSTVGRHGRNPDIKVGVCRDGEVPDSEPAVGERW